MSEGQRGAACTPRGLIQAVTAAAPSPSPSPAATGPPNDAAQRISTAHAPCDRRAASHSQDRDVAHDRASLDQSVQAGQLHSQRHVAAGGQQAGKLEDVLLGAGFFPRRPCVRTPVSCGHARAPVHHLARGFAAWLCAAKRDAWWGGIDRSAWLPCETTGSAGAWPCHSGGAQCFPVCSISITQTMLHAADAQTSGPKRRGFCTKPGKHLLAADAVHGQRLQAGAHPQHLPHQLESVRALHLHH